MHTPDLVLHPSPLAHWSTASFSHHPAATASEQSSLSEHLQLCRGLAGGQTSWQWGALAVHGFLAARFVTTLVLVSMAFGVAMVIAS
jgi:hypothetical protein